MGKYDQGCAWGSTFSAFRGACRDDIVQQIGHQESGALNVTASDRHACLEHWQQLACSHIQTVSKRSVHVQVLAVLQCIPAEDHLQTASTRLS